MLDLCRFADGGRLCWRWKDLLITSLAEHKGTIVISDYTTYSSLGCKSIKDFYSILLIKQLVVG